MLNTRVSSEAGSRRRIERSWRLVSRRGADFRTIELCRRVVLADGLEKTRTRTFHPDGLSVIGTFDYLRRCHIVIRVQESPITKASEHQ
jgi:hypothetical protein